MNLGAFFAGIGLATFTASAIFFLKFWRVSRDSFFLCFAIACVLMASERFSAIINVPAPGIVPPPESTIWVYVVRLIAFAVIFIAILRKNRARATKF